MSVSAYTPNSYQTNNSTTAFAITFSYHSTSEIAAVLINNTTGVRTTLALTTNFTITTTGDGNPYTGGTLTTLATWDEGYTLLIYRNSSQVQSTDLVEGGTVYAANMEAQHDKTMMLIQELQKQIDRCIKVPVGDAESEGYADGYATLDNSVDRAGSYSAYDSTGQPTVVAGVLPDDVATTPFGESLVNTANAAAGRTVLGLGDASTLAKDTDGTLAANSDAKVATQKAVKTYVDTEISDSLVIAGATYTIYKSGSTYYAEASAESGLTSYSGTDCVDVLDSVMAVVGVNGTDYTAGLSIVFREGVYTFTKTWNIPPTQTITIDARYAQFTYSPITGDIINLDSTMNSRFIFGVIDAATTTTGKGFNIAPVTIGPDSVAVCGASYFHFGAVVNTGGVGISLDSTSANINGNTIDIDEMNLCATGLEILNPSVGNDTYVMYNQFKFHGHDIVLNVQVGESQTDRISNNIFTGAITGTSIAGDIGIKCYGDQNVFLLNAERVGANTSSNSDIIFYAGTSGNIAIGNLDDGYTDSGQNSVYTSTLQNQSYKTVTATADGLTTGLIPAGATCVLVVCDTATKAITLPACKIGHTIKIITAGPGAAGDALCELWATGTNVAINDVVCSATNEMAMKAYYHYIAECVSTTRWIVRGFTEKGADLAAIVPDAR